MMKILSRETTTRTYGLFAIFGFGTTIPVIKYRIEFEIGVNQSTKVVFDIETSQKPWDYMRTVFTDQISGPEPTEDQDIEMTRQYMARDPDNPRNMQADHDYFDSFYGRLPGDQDPIPPYDPDNPDADVESILDGLEV
jgi:hypothetical protein